MLLKNLVLQGLSFHLRNHFRSNLAGITIKHSHDRSLADEHIAAPLNLVQFGFTIFVHLVGVGADKSFVAFYRSASTAELGDGVVFQDFTHAMQHEPRRLLRDLKSSRHLRAADSILAVDYHPEGRHPLVHAERRVLEDGSDLNAELLLASLAPPHQPCAQKRVLLAATSWTGYLLSRPAQIDCIHESLLGIGEISNRFLQGFGLFDVRHFFALSLL